MADLHITWDEYNRKTEQLAWAQCQANECGCSPLNVPALTGGNTPTGNNSHEKIVGTVCACVGDCSGQSATIGGSISMQSATHQCNGQMCTNNDLNKTYQLIGGITNNKWVVQSSGGVSSSDTLKSATTVTIYADSTSGNPFSAVVSISRVTSLI